MRYLFFLSLLFWTLNFSAQKTFTFSYNFGANRPNSESLKTFQKEIKDVDFSTVDSIHFIGNSDSVGTFLSNFRSTELRSRKLKKYFIGKIENSTTYSILPTSGDWPKKKGSTRQINVVLYSSQPVKPAANEKETPKGCYKVAYSEILNCHRSDSNKGKKSVTQLTRAISKVNENRPDLYAGRLNQEGKFEAIPLKWKIEKVGESWWAAKKECAEIPTDDFEKFKIFTIENGPCTSCHEDFQQNLEIEKSILKLETDKYVMDNLQFKSSIFRQNKIQIRVPKEFVDSDADYFQTSNLDNEIIWEEKDGTYFYTLLEYKNGLISPISKKFIAHQDSVCQENKILDYKKSICGPSPKKISAYNFVEFGYHFQNKTQIPYAALGLFAATKYVDLEFLAGVHAHSALFASIRGRYNFLTLSFANIASVSQWKQSMNKNRFWYTNLYVSAEYKASLGRKTSNYLEPNFNIGMTISQNTGPIFHRIFLQYGVGVNFLEKSPRPSYTIFQAGIQLQLGKKTYAYEKGNFSQ